MIYSIQTSDNFNSPFDLLEKNSQGGSHPIADFSMRAAILAGSASTAEQDEEIRGKCFIPSEPDPEDHIPGVISDHRVNNASHVEVCRS